MNTTIIGTIGQIDLRFTAGGKAVCSMSVAENHRRKDAAGNWENAGTTWWECTVWEQAAENAANDLTKGDRVIVVGDTFTEEFTRKDGAAGKALKVRVLEVGKSLRWANTPGGGGGSRPAPASDPWGSTPTSSYRDEPPFFHNTPHGI